MLIVFDDTMADMLSSTKFSSVVTELLIRGRYLNITREETLEKKAFLNNLGLLFSARENHFNSLKSRLFPIPNLGKIAIREPTLEPAQDQK